MLLAIEQAQVSIHLEVYAFSPTGIGARFIEALGSAAARGVQVEVLLDGEAWSADHCFDHCHRKGEKANRP
jgi:hypothetical protein